MFTRIADYFRYRRVVYLLCIHAFSLANGIVLFAAMTTRQFFFFHTLFAIQLFNCPTDYFSIMVHTHYLFVLLNNAFVFSNDSHIYNRRLFAVEYSLLHVLSIYPLSYRYNTLSTPKWLDDTYIKTTMDSKSEEIIQRRRQLSFVFRKRFASPIASVFPNPNTWGLV